MNKHHYCIIMAGGLSNHFWPISRDHKPKQFLKLPGSDKSFIQKAFDRCLEIVPKENILVVGLEKHEGIIRHQLPQLLEYNLLLEPYGRKTAPCIAFATYYVLQRDPKAVTAIFPCDLVIKNEESFKKDIQKSLEYSENNDVLITLGVTPTRPDPNFGYIQILGGKSALNTCHDKPIKVKTFTEKPDIEIAKAFCKSGEFFWNSGIFIWQAEVIKKEMQKYLPEITSQFEGWECAFGSTAHKAFINRAYTECPQLSIDYGVMEKTDKAWLYPAQFGWSDIDNWDTLHESFEFKDEYGNIIGAKKCFCKNIKNSIIISENKNKLVAINGLEDYVIIDTDDVLLICPKDSKQYKDFIAGMRMPGYNEYK